MILLLTLGEDDLPIVEKLPTVSQPSVENKKAEDIICDEFAPNIEMNIEAAEGFTNFCGWLGKGTKKM